MSHGGVKGALVKKICWLFLLALPCTSAKAAQWAVCDLRVKILKVNAVERTLEAAVQKTNPGTAHAECPLPGTVLEFRPETRDYRSELPRKRWPAVTQTVALQYRF